MHCKRILQGGRHQYARAVQQMLVLLAKNDANQCSTFSLRLLILAVVILQQPFILPAFLVRSRALHGLPDVECMLGEYVSALGAPGKVFPRFGVALRVGVKDSHSSVWPLEWSVTPKRGIL